VSAAAGSGGGVLVTGGTGYLGVRLVETLRVRAARVRVLARPGADTKRLAALGVEIVRGDVTVPATLAAAVEGLPVVIHAAGKVSDWGPGEPLILPRILALLRRGRMVYPGGGYNHLGLAYVDNLVEGLILASTVPAAAGRLFHITDGEDVTCREVLDAIAAALGVPPPRRAVPFPVVYAIAALLEGVAKAVRSSSPPVSFREGVARLAPE